MKLSEKFQANETAPKNSSWMISYDSAKWCLIPASTIEVVCSSCSSREWCSMASDRAGDSFVDSQSSRMETISEGSVTFNDSVNYPDAKYDEDAHDEEEDDDYLEEKGPSVAPPSSPEDATVSIGRSSGVRPLSRNLTDE
ncbi:unnamed protein product [Phytophthora lilii]|uniref:Unnamed protein product n=1 Tax=Phytophthora lilii TaxID=2077276 RepID=A0A9W6TQ26_9STRA|nr:unnamed protein product [Phytophthora lilii]